MFGVIIGQPHCPSKDDADPWPPLLMVMILLHLRPSSYNSFGSPIITASVTLILDTY